MENRKQDMTDIISIDGGDELIETDQPHILSVSAKKFKQETEKGKGIHKEHKKKMKGIKGSKFRQNMKNKNSAFFSEAKASVSNTKGWAIDFGPIKGNEFSKTETESEAKLMRQQLEEEKLKEDKKKIIKESDIPELNKQNREKFLTEGEYVYELFAILTHSGDVRDAHYYAHVKDYGTDNWFNYNDTQVRPMYISEVKNAFGGYDYKSTLIFIHNRISS